MAGFSSHTFGSKMVPPAHSDLMGYQFFTITSKIKFVRLLGLLFQGHINLSFLCKSCQNAKDHILLSHCSSLAFCMIFLILVQNALQIYLFAQFLAPLLGEDENIDPDAEREKCKDLNMMEAKAN